MQIDAKSVQLNMWPTAPLTVYTYCAVLAADGADSRAGPVPMPAAASDAAN